MIATQVNIKTFIEEVVTLALRNVFGDEYSFKVEYEIKRGKPEASLKVLKGDLEFDPADECGGGIVDVAALGLRVALWSLSDPKSQPVLILDEPGKHVSRDLIDKFGDMINVLSETLGLQVIMVTHDSSLIEKSDRAFEVAQQDKLSQVTIV
jgi:DNA repair exonuclease SbcCD ATPase subunit